VNVILTVLKIIVLVMSGSISILASLLDSILDLVSGSIIFVSNWMMVMPLKDFSKYPVGKRRLETLAVIVFSSCMFTATTELIIQSVERIITPTNDLSFDYVSIGIVTAIILIKFTLWNICRRSDSPTMQAVAQDHINDVYTNAVGILFGLLGFYFWTNLDPIGGIVIGSFIMLTWFRTGIENVQLMTGRTADPSILSMLTYVAYSHDPRVLAVDTVRAYYVSNRLLVEVDIVLPEKMALKEAHDIGEELQKKIEKLSGIERAFVHLDFEYDHRHMDEHPTLHSVIKKSGKEGLVVLEDSNKVVV